MARRFLTVASLAAAALLSAGCGSQAIGVAKDSPDRTGAVLFAERCGSCHTLSVAGTQGSATNVGDRENVDGPNFDTRKESVSDVAYAIENGGFSGAIMPENIATGAEKQAIASFLAKYAGSDVKSPTPTGASATSATEESSPGGEKSSGREAPG